MKKEEADVLKREFNEGTSEEDALNFMSSESLEESQMVLDFLEKYLGTAITDYCLDESYDLLDTDQGDLVRTLWFSRGMEDTFVCINPRFQIKGFDADIPLLLLSQVAEHLEKLRTMLTSEGEREIKKWRTDGREGF